MLQMKEQNKTPEEELSEGEMGNLPKKEFRVMTIKMIEEIGRRMEAQSDKLEVFHKELENIKNNQTEMKNTIIAMKNTLEGINSRLNDREEQISELEYRVVEITATKEKRKKRMKRNKDSLRDPWDNIECTNIHIIGVPEGEEREKRPEKILEVIIAEASLTWERKQSPSPRSAESPIRD